MRTIRHTCTHCGQLDQIPVALMLTCPACAAPAGRSCTDLRKGPGVEIKTPHPDRRDAADGRADQARDAAIRALRSVS